jgi:acyl-CoA synthetase (NDP forming)
VASEKVPDIVDQVIEHQTAEAAMLIAGGMGETRESRERAAQMMEKIGEAHLASDGGPVFLGANCLGVISHPGKYDTLFIPEAKLPRQRDVKKGRAAFISQSGAFMITRLSKRPDLNPSYMISVGNQNDLTLGDMVNYLKDDADLDVIAVYAEGFKDLDGLAASRAVRNAVLAGKDVIFYKAGRTPEGRNATSGHTATLAGDYMVCESCVTQAGGIVAETFSQFEDLLMLSQRLHGKRINGNRLAAVSGAGFEAVCIADNIQSETFAMQMAAFGPDAAGKLRQMLVEKGLDRLVEVKNPLDINPAADDEAHVRAVQYLAEDSGVDAVVVGLDPLSPAMRTLAESDSQQYDMDNEASIASQMPKLIAKLDKPVIGVVDGGDIFDPLIDRLVRSGMAVFTSSDAAVQTLALYIQGRLYAERLRAQLSAQTC